MDFKFAGPSRPKRDRVASGVPTGPARHVLFTTVILYVRRFRRHVQYTSLFWYYFPRTNPPARERFNCRNAAACVGGKQLRLRARISAVVAGHGGRCHRSHVGNPFTVASHVICLRYEFPISK